MPLVIAMMAVLLMSALGASLVLTTSAETIISGNYRNSREAVYAAEAGLERAMADLPAVPDWSLLFSGTLRSGFTDGPPSGKRTVSGGAIIDLTQAVNMADCEKVTACSASDLTAVTTERPWGANNPRWQLYAYGRVADLLPARTIDSPYYVVVLVGDDPSENDGQPLLDGMNLNNSGSGILWLRGEAFGPGASHARIEATVARLPASAGGNGPAPLRVLSWRLTPR